MIEYSMLIGGEWTDSESGARFVRDEPVVR